MCFKFIKNVDHFKIVKIKKIGIPSECPQMICLFRDFQVNIYSECLRAFQRKC